MKYRKYLVIAFIGALFLPLLSAKAKNAPEETFDVKSIVFIEQEQETNLGFDTAAYLPEGFNAYEGNVNPKTLNFIEEDSVELGFDTAEFLPQDFNAFEK